MRCTPIILVFLSSLLASSSPLPTPPGATSGNDGAQIAKRGASVVRFHHGNARSTTARGTKSNVQLAQLERTRVRWKWSSVVGGKRTQAVKKVGKVYSYHYKRDGEAAAEPFDIVAKRDGLQGTDPMSSDWEGFDVSYSGAISGDYHGANTWAHFGTPYQQTTVQFDTGSSDLVLPTFSISYEDESGASGVLVTDTVSVAGLTVPQQTFAAVSSETEGFSDPYAGILGLGFLPNAASNSTPFFANLVQSGSLASNIFSFYMTRGGVQGSELCLGCVNSGKFTGAVTFYPVVTFTESGEPFEWDIQSTGLSYQGSVNSTSGELPKAWQSKEFVATIDSGTTFIYVSKKIAKAFYEQIGERAPTLSPCDTVNGMGTISFGFGGQEYAIDLRDFNAGPESE
ncbi:hypothetical protein FRC01_006800 [Tulasnella sp. 417]|nr:hypothetical protein FRC01_006800 [Tulasnella sp. 417]